MKKKYVFDDFSHDDLVTYNLEHFGDTFAFLSVAIYNEVIFNIISDATDSGCEYVVLPVNLLVRL